LCSAAFAAFLLALVISSIIAYAALRALSSTTIYDQGNPNNEAR